MLKVDEIKEIIKVIDESSINEFSYEAEGTKVTMKKEITLKNIPEITNEVAIPSNQEIVTLTEHAIGNQSDQETVTKTDEVDYDYEVCSPMVGTLYNSPSPETDPYVSVGSNVKKDTIVCIVEAMKLFNEIEAEVSGEVVEVLVENGELVEYGQPLFRVKKK